MPYINQAERELVNPALNELLKIRLIGPGIANYVVTRFLAGTMDTTSYRGINEIIGVLECAKLEFYRRVAASYEDQKIQENGDVY